MFGSASSKLQRHASRLHHREVFVEREERRRMAERVDGDQQVECLRGDAASSQREAEVASFRPERIGLGEKVAAGEQRQDRRALTLVGKPTPDLGPATMLWAADEEVEHDRGRVAVARDGTHDGLRNTARG
ncbi:MAG TPA: hypothetical protein VHU80_11510 [Polyangiaceae bacterium]|jgi:hypothetical protein|nr:hypothetical protein [Polyangiaceae bacterium]